MIRYVGAEPSGLPLGRTVFVKVRTRSPRWAETRCVSSKSLCKVCRVLTQQCMTVARHCATLRRGLVSLSITAKRADGRSGQGNGPDVFCPSSGSWQTWSGPMHTPKPGPGAIIYLDHRRGRAGISISRCTLQENAVEEGHLGKSSLYLRAGDATEDALVAQNVAFESEEIVRQRGILWHLILRSKWRIAFTLAHEARLPYFDPLRTLTERCEAARRVATAKGGSYRSSIR